MFLTSFGFRSAVVTPKHSLATRISQVEKFNQRLVDILVACDGVLEAELEAASLEDLATSPHSTLIKKKKRKNEDSKSLMSRGVDFRGATAVLNFDCPRDSEDYLHKIGRAARDFKQSGIAGLAVTFLGKNELADFEPVT